MQTNRNGAQFITYHSGAKCEPFVYLRAKLSPQRLAIIDYASSPFQLLFFFDLAWCWAKR